MTSFEQHLSWLTARRFYQPPRSGPEWTDGPGPSAAGELVTLLLEVGEPLSLTGDDVGRSLRDERVGGEEPTDAFDVPLELRDPGIPTRRPTVGRRLHTKPRGPKRARRNVRRTLAAVARLDRARPRERLEIERRRTDRLGGSSVDRLDDERHPGAGLGPRLGPQVADAADERRDAL